jgi:hypothetical protein
MTDPKVSFRDRLRVFYSTFDEIWHDKGAFNKEEVTASVHLKVNS